MRERRKEYEGRKEGRIMKEEGRKENEGRKEGRKGEEQRRAAGQTDGK